MKKFNPKQKNKERRGHSREKLVTYVSYKVLTPAGDKGISQNISEGGLCLTLNKKLLPGTLLELIFDLPRKEAKKVETFAKVVWQRKTEKGFLTGVKFNID